MRILRALAVILLLYVSLTAIYGGVHLIRDAHGNPWGMMPLSLLQYSPFHSWLIPGIILLTANGLLGLWVLGLVLAHRRRREGLWTAFQGCVLLGWLVVECVLLRVVAWPHYLYGAVALALIVVGFALRRDAHPKIPAY